MDQFELLNNVQYVISNIKIPLKSVTIMNTEEIILWDIRKELSPQVPITWLYLNK